MIKRRFDLWAGAGEKVVVGDLELVERHGAAWHKAQYELAWIDPEGRSWLTDLSGIRHLMTWPAPA